MSRAVPLAAAALLITGACSDDGPRTTSPQSAPNAPGDAAAQSSTSLGDDTVDDGRGGKRTVRTKTRTERTIDLVLRSTPTGARVTIGGEDVGMTPTLWSMEPQTAPVEFIFWLPNHAATRFKFIPISSGLVHPRLEPIVQPTLDGGLGPQIAPVLAPDAAAPPPDAPPPPIDAAEPPPPPVDAAPLGPPP